MSILTQSIALIRSAGRRLLPQDCVLCGSGGGDDLLCPECERDLPFLANVRCPCCALPTTRGEICGRCLGKPPHYDATFAVYRYAFPVDKLLQSFKYAHRLALGQWFGERMATLADGLDCDLIVPMPLHRDRLRERGFNQALELARSVSRRTRVALDPHSCVRIRSTRTQAELPWSERVGNVRSAFQCALDLEGKHVLLIDDVMTTGASLDELARTVKLHGARRATLLTVARALPP